MKAKTKVTFTFGAYTEFFSARPPLGTESPGSHLSRRGRGQIPYSPPPTSYKRQTPLIHLSELCYVIMISNPDFRKKLETILISDLNENESLENLLRHWNHSVLFDLETLMKNLEKILDLKLELFMQNRENRNLFSMLGFEVKRKCAL